ncbi:MAG: DUF2779 domain-containing protein [bacterium]
MTKQLSKTDFILYKECSKNVWIKWHQPEEYAKFEVSEFEKSLGVVGIEVEELARRMFPDGYLIERRSEGAQELTRKLITEHYPVIFQAVFGTEKYLTATDILIWNTDANAYDLYEIKMSSTTNHEEGGDGDEDEEGDESKPKKINKKKELQYEYDLAFQVNVLEMCGVPVNKKYLVRLNKKYKKLGDLEVKLGQLFVEEDKTEKVDKLMLVAKSEMEEAFAYLLNAKPIEGHCSCYYKGRSSHCTTFSISNPGVPSYSVHDLNRIGNSKAFLKELLDKDILKIDKVPEDKIPKIKKAKEGEKPKRPRKLYQVQTYKTKEQRIEYSDIKAELNSLTFPLYFLDYETYPSAIPLFNRYHPYQNIVFQYSLHVLTEDDFKNGREPKHYEELFLDGDPAERMVESLREHIGDTGSVVSWFKSFENSRNRELASLVPLQSIFLNDVIKRTYDLMDIVENQYYVHHGFKGKSSIKNVQPVLAPDFAYKSLNVQSGADAMEAYRQILKGELTGRALEEKKEQMLKYCMYDTKVMYVIWKFFVDLNK